MDLEDIGFYSLEDDRAKQVSMYSPLWRCELLVTSQCNFRCLYCRGLQTEKPELSFDDARRVIDIWGGQGLRNVRFSGGEPTTWPHLLRLVEHTVSACHDIKHIAISTNGYADYSYYQDLIGAGVNDLSISLDACCASTGDMMSGGIPGSWERVCDNTQKLSELTYVTAGVVLTQDTIGDLVDIIYFAHSLGVADIRIISSAQWNDPAAWNNVHIDSVVLDAHPILKYRFGNFKNGRNVRGIRANDCHKCWLMLDDMAVKDDKHYPCIIKLREGCTPVGKIDGAVRENRYKYILEHDTYIDSICRKNCLDVCIDYNNKVNSYVAKATGTFV